MEAVRDCFRSCPCPIFSQTVDDSRATTEEDSTNSKDLAQPLLSSTSKSKPRYYREPLLVARVARETEDGNWDQLETLATPSNWIKLPALRGLGFGSDDEDSEIEEASEDVEKTTGRLIQVNDRESPRKDKKNARFVDEEMLLEEENEADAESVSEGDENEMDDLDLDSNSTPNSRNWRRRKITRRKNRSIVSDVPSSSVRPKLTKSGSSASVTAVSEISPHIKKLTSISSEDNLSHSRYKGKTFSHLFSLAEQIGFGSTANVYKCREKRQLNRYHSTSSQDRDRVFAVKVLDKIKLMQLGGKARKGAQLLRQFKQEVEILDNLRHPHIIRLFGMFESEKTLHVVTEFCAGGELFDYLTSQPDGILPEDLARNLVFQVASAVCYMHEMGIIHRDIKLENILLSKKPENIDDKIDLKIIDFGLAKATGYMLSKHSLEARGNNSKGGRAQTFFGTLGYLAPEMFFDKTYNHSVDVWAVGVLTYILLCGNFPFDDSPAQISKMRSNKVNLKEKYRLRIPGRVKKNLSKDSKSFMTALLDPDPKTRVRAADALEHPWLKVLETEQ